ncbi:hypothetical protein Avbf_14038 [Armadillidium vulgare]|nr:hypothetical protein Avbf_14038 [Armadillidium vulgare]
MSNLLLMLVLDDKVECCACKDIKHLSKNWKISKKKIFKSTGLRKTIKPILKNMKDQCMKAHFNLGASKESFSKQKRIASVPFSMLESTSETELDDHSSKNLFKKQNKGKELFFDHFLPENILTLGGRKQFVR